MTKTRHTGVYRMGCHAGTLTRVKSRGFVTEEKKNGYSRIKRLLLNPKEQETRGRWATKADSRSEAIRDDMLKTWGTETEFKIRGRMKTHSEGEKLAVNADSFTQLLVVLMPAYHPRTQAAETEGRLQVHSQSGLHKECQSSQDYRVSPCLNTFKPSRYWTPSL